MDLKPIETIYNGYRFRSRSEARWAVFFDSLGIEYEYEPEGYRLSDGTMYLPDFYLPESDQFFEVKGILTEKDEHKIYQFVNDMNKCVTLGYSNFHFKTCTCYEIYDFDNKAYKFFKQADDGECPTHLLCHCRACGTYWFTTHFSTFICQGCGERDGIDYFDIDANCRFGKMYIRTGSEVEQAIINARQARFEHGEAPHV